MKQIHSKIEEITEQGKFLYQTYTVWLEFVDPRVNYKHRKVLEEHPELFGVIAESLFSSVITTMSALCEKPNPTPKKDVLSVHGIVKLLDGKCPGLEANIQTAIGAYEPELELLSQIRHKVYAHRDKNICPELVFKSVNISPERIHSCVAAIVEAIDLINVAAGVKSKGITTLEILNEVDRVETSLAKVLS